MKLRDYQNTVVENSRDLVRKSIKRFIIHAATGSGKTIIVASIVDNAISKNKKVLFLVHLRELAFQAKDRFTEFGLGDEIGVIMSGEESDLDKPIQIASVQTYSRRLNFDEQSYNPWFHDADLVIYDEAHASIARTRKAILELYKKDAVIIGLTATPCRADGRGLGEVYDGIVSCIDITDLTEQGFLVPAIYYGAKKLPDLKNIPLVANDYNKKILGERVDKPKLIGDIYDNWARIAIERPTVIFATNVKHSKHIKELFERRGISIEHIDAHTPKEERHDIFRRFENGDIQVLTNVGVMEEGVDFPWVSCVVLARPSKSYAKYVQRAGRGLRPYCNKDNCIIIDHAGMVNSHGFLDDDVYWTLNGKEKAWKKKTERIKEKTIFTCDECGTIFTGKRCSLCGWEVPDWGKKILTTDHELKRLGKNKKPKATMEEKRLFWGQLEYYRKSKGYHAGWSYYKFKAKFGIEPHEKVKRIGDISPYEAGVKADDKFQNWIKYQNIKWAKSKSNPNMVVV